MHRPVYTEAEQNRAEIADIKNRYLSGCITRQQAQYEAAPIIKRINAKQQEIALKHGKKNYPKVTFIGLMR